MKITLNAGSCAMLDAFEPIILPNEVEIEFNSSHYKRNTLAITAKNGDIKERPYGFISNKSVAQKFWRRIEILEDAMKKYE